MDELVAALRDLADSWERQARLDRTAAKTSGRAWLDHAATLGLGHADAVRNLLPTEPDGDT